MNQVGLNRACVRALLMMGMTFLLVLSVAATDVREVGKLEERCEAGSEHACRRLAKIAVLDEDRWVRKAAVKGLNDQSLLADIAKNDPHSVVRQAAVESLLDQTLLSEVSRKATDPNVRLIATGSLEDQKARAEIARTDPDADVRKAVVENLGAESWSAEAHQWLFEELARSDSSPSVRRVALENLNNEELVLQIALSDSSATVGGILAHLQSYQNSDGLATIAMNTPNPQAAIRGQWTRFDPKKGFQGGDRAAAIARIEDQRVLEHIAWGDPDQWIRVEATRKVENQKLLCAIAKNRGGHAPLAALKRIREPDQLWDVALNATDGVIRKAAERQLGPELVASFLIKREEAARRITEGRILALREKLGFVTPDIEPYVAIRKEPEYPEMASRRKIQGTVVLLVVVAQDGQPEDVEVVRSVSRGLDNAAIEAARSFRFWPATEDGQAVRSSAVLRFDFELR